MNEEILCKDEEQEINLIGLFWAVLRQWRKIICWAIIFAIIFFVGKFALAEINLHFGDQEEIEQAYKDYETLLDNIEQRIKYVHTRMDTINDQIVEVNRYNNNSVIMEIDAYNILKLQARYYVKTDYEIMPDMQYQNKDYTSSIVSTYVSILTSAGFLQPVADELGMELIYLKELISVWNAGDGVLAINIYSNSDSLNLKIMQAFEQGIEENKSIIESTIDEHDITLLTYSTFVDEDTSVEDYQVAQKEKVTNLQVTYSELSASIEEIEDEAEEIEEPEYKPLKILKRSIKYGIIGGFFGAVIICAIVLCKYLFNDFLYSGDVLEEKLKVRILGKASKTDKKPGKIDAFIKSKENREDFENNDTNLLLAANRLKGMNENAKIFALTGEAGEEFIKEVTEGFKKAYPEVQFIFAPSCLTKPDSVIELKKADAVILVEEAGKSKYTHIYKEVKLVSEFNKPVMGAFVFED